MENAISVLTLLPSTKEQKQSFIERVRDEMISGNYNPLEIELQLKIMEDVTKELRKNFKEQTLKEAAKYPEKTFEYKGMKITKSGRTTYDYSTCGLSEYNRIKERIKELEDSLKQAGKVEIIDPETGQVCNPPATAFSEYLKIEYL